MALVKVILTYSVEMAPDDIMLECGRERIANVAISGVYLNQSGQRTGMLDGLGWAITKEPSITAKLHSLTDDKPTWIALPKFIKRK